MTVIVWSPFAAVLPWMPARIARWPVEKPCGLTVEETEMCALLAAEAGVLLRVAYWRRCVPDLAALRRRILAGELGEILAVNCYQWVRRTASQPT